MDNLSVSSCDGSIPLTRSEIDSTDTKEDDNFKLIRQGNHIRYITGNRLAHLFREEKSSNRVLFAEKVKTMY